MNYFRVLLSIVLCSVLLAMSGKALASDKLIYEFEFAPHQGMVNETEKEFRKEICLNGLWDFQAVAVPSSYKYGEGVAPEMSKPTNAWDKTKIRIPSPWNINDFANRNMEGPDHRNFPSYPKEWESVKMAWMRKSVTIPQEWSQKQIQLHFEAVAGYTEVYVDGEKVGENFDIFLPFTIDITEQVSAGQTIEVLVGVRSQSMFEDRSTIGRRIVPAGSMWGYHINGIWQDVFLIALPKVNIKDVFVKPLVSQNKLELDVVVENNTSKSETIELDGLVNRWLNKAGNEINSAPVPNWELGDKALSISAEKLKVEANSSVTHTIEVAVEPGELDFWSPDHPNLYALRLSLKNKKSTIDTKYERFGWREWTFEGSQQCLNGEAIELKGDSWHFMGIPQLTRRYAWAWYTAIKGMNGNAVRPHAQIYPRFYLDMADEMGICVMNETANWASDGGPKLDSDKFWEASKDHLERFVLRDRNHASVFGWSISNENKPVILHVYNKPELMPAQKQAWIDWRDIVMKHDPTRPWISADGEDDGDGVLPTTVGHYGDMNAMKRWVEIGKPWGIGEHSMAYYGTPEQVSVYNGEEAYESQYGRMKGLANECYHLLANQRNMNASYASVFNMAWYSLKPLPIGKKDLTTPPSLTEDGVFFTHFEEGVPGVQPERMGPYCTTFNPGYDPSLPVFDPWPMYKAMRAANAPGAPEWSPYKDVPKAKVMPQREPLKNYSDVVFVGEQDSRVKQIMDAQGVEFTDKVKTPSQLLYIVDGSSVLSHKDKSSILPNIAKGADIWIWGITPQTLNAYNEILPLEVKLEDRKISSFIPEQKSWIYGLKNSDFYFCEIQTSDASEYGIAGLFADEGDVLLNACNTDWRKWNKRPEELKTAAVIRSEREAKGAAPVFVKYQSGASAYYVSTLTEFANSEKGFNTLATILKNAGVKRHKVEANADEVFFIRDGNLQFPPIAKSKFKAKGDKHTLTFWMFSPRPLDDLLIEPNMPKLTLYVDTWESALAINDEPFVAQHITNRNSTYNEIPLLQGWNKVTLEIGAEDKGRFNAHFKCSNNPKFLSLLKVSFSNPEAK